jgi:hypothetical protein
VRVRGDFDGFEGFDPHDEVFCQRIIGGLSGLGADEALTIAEFGPGQLTVWEVRQDQAGTPRWFAWPASWPEFTEEGELSWRKLRDFIAPEIAARLMLVHEPGIGSADNVGYAALALAKQIYPTAPSIRLSRPVSELIAEAAVRVPLCQWYELAALRQAESGKLIPTVQPLFPPGARRGDKRPFTIWTEQADDPSVCFVVLAREDDADPPDYRVVSLESASLPPDEYRLTATLLRPGRVRFDGLSEPLSADDRSWDDVLGAVPGRIIRHLPAHLIIAIELCGPQPLFDQRVDCAQRLIEAIEAGPGGPVSYSLVGYGAHAHARMTQDLPVEELCWADSAPIALGALAALGKRRAQTEGSDLAAKLECALHHVHRRLPAGASSAAGRPALVAIGTRPPFLHAQDLSDALPCPQGLDWRKAINGLTERHDGIALGAIYDGYPVVDAWASLGSHARARPSAFDARQFALDLGLLSQLQPAMPLPLIEDGGR